MRFISFLQPYQSLLIFLSSALTIFLRADLQVVPDSYEHAIISACWIDSDTIFMDCSRVNMLFRQPLPSFLVFLSSPIFAPFVGIAFWAWFSCATLLWSVWKIGIKLIGAPFGFWAWLGFISSPFIAEYGMFADSRIIVLPLILWSFFLVSDNKSSQSQLLIGQFLIILAFFTRMECLLLVGLYWFIQFISNKESWKYSLLLIVISVGMWLFGIWQQEDIFSISPRYWEGYLVQIANSIPLRWSQELFGMGIFSPPLREIAMQYPSVAITPTIQLSDWLSWVERAFISLFPSWSWVVFLIGFFSSKKKTQRKLFIFASIALPSLLITLLPQARDPVFTTSYAFPIWMIGLLGIIWSLFQLVQRWKISARLQQLAMAIFIFFLSLQSTVSSLPTPFEFSAPAQSAIQWIEKNTAPNAIIRSSYEIAPVVFLANRRWEEWVSPLGIAVPHDNDIPIYALVWSEDPHAHYPLLQQENQHPQAYFSMQQDNARPNFALAIISIEALQR